MDSLFCAVSGSSLAATNFNPFISISNSSVRESFTSGSALQMQSSLRLQSGISRCVKPINAIATISAGEIKEEVTLQESSNSLAPNAFEVQSLLMEVCDKTSIAELDLKVGAFRLHVKRDVGKLKGSAPAVPVAPPVPSEPMVESGPHVALPSVPSSKPPVTSAAAILANSASKLGSKFGILEAAADEGLLFVTSPKVGLFRRSRVVKGKSGRPLCEEGQIVKEGQVVCYVEQLETQQPVERQESKRHFTGKTTDEREALRDAKKCYICEEGHFANECPQRNSQNKDDKFDRKGKKPKPSARLVPDLSDPNFSAAPMASGEGQSNPSTSGDAGGDHNEDYGNEYGPPLSTLEELCEKEHCRLVDEATNMMLNFAKDPKLAKYMRETAFQDVHAQWKATTTSPPKPNSKKQYSEKKLEQEVEARLAQILTRTRKAKSTAKSGGKALIFLAIWDVSQLSTKQRSTRSMQKVVVLLLLLLTILQIRAKKTERARSEARSNDTGRARKRQESLNLVE
ncbi:hypothetical protein L7F22_040487 [Adiantum nelumboides]|nr:hypothetical protein [Adiantum nelumboides]